MEKIRTNNDNEGWHNRLNRKGKTKISFYELLKLLKEEAELMELQTELVRAKLGEG